jgi:hypothetical protein
MNLSFDLAVFPAHHLLWRPVESTSIWQVTLPPRFVARLALALIAEEMFYSSRQAGAEAATRKSA